MITSMTPEELEDLKKEALEIAEDFENRDSVTLSEGYRLAQLVRKILGSTI